MICLQQCHVHKRYASVLYPFMASRIDKNGARTGVRMFPICGLAPINRLPVTILWHLAKVTVTNGNSHARVCAGVPSHIVPMVEGS